MARLNGRVELVSVVQSDQVFKLPKSWYSDSQSKQKPYSEEPDFTGTGASCDKLWGPTITCGLPTNRPQRGETGARNPKRNAGAFISEVKLTTTASCHEGLSRRGFYQVLASVHLTSVNPRGSLDHVTMSASKLEEIESGSGRTRPPRACPPPTIIDDHRRNRAISIRERRHGSPARRNGHSREPRTPMSRSKTGRPILR